MIRIEYDRHEGLLRLLAGTDETAEANDFREGFVASETADDLLEPSFRPLTENRSAQFRQFLLHARQPRFQLFGGGHTSHSHRSAAEGKANLAGFPPV